jgi:hypothetical protein
MKRMVAALVLILGLALCKFAVAQHHKCCVLPTPKLLTCRSTDCSRLWPEQAEPGAAYPKQVTVDVNVDCIYGLTASYDKSVPLEEIRAAIDERYKQWAVNIPPNSPPYIWRVEPERFAIQLSVAGKQHAKKKLADAGTNQVIYLAFGGESACATH